MSSLILDAAKTEIVHHWHPNLPGMSILLVETGRRYFVKPSLTFTTKMPPLSAMDASLVLPNCIPPIVICIQAITFAALASGGRTISLVRDKLGSWPSVDFAAFKVQHAKPVATLPGQAQMAWN